MPELTYADVRALEGWDMRTPILVVVSCAALGLCWLTSRMTPLPFGDLLFVLAVSAYAAFEMSRGGKAEAAGSLPAPASARVGDAGLGGFLRQRHELLGLLTKPDRRVRAMALGVGGLVMLLWRLFGARLAGVTTELGRGRLQVQGWIFTLAASKATKFVARRAMVAAVRLSNGLAWVPLRAVLLAFCCGVAALLHQFVPGGHRLPTLRQWALQWLFAISVGEACWCYVRWQLWRRISRLRSASLWWWSGEAGCGKRL
mmetsp:Transcript_9079/g.26758  ORF Transcript_9079/g.26758 Transcript_9079/m.26758 type:complete len:258 (-) Transcript_9079:10-783(-)